MKRILTVMTTIALVLCTVLSFGIFAYAESTVTETDWLAAPERLLVKCPGGDCDHTECDYVYSFAVIGDTQSLVRTDATAYSTALKSDPTLTYESYGEAKIKTLYNWILDNKTDKNIQYVLGLGDITEAFQSTSSYYAKEWGLSKAAIELLNGKIGYSLVRGNHDITSGFNSAFGKGTQYYNALDSLTKITDAEGRPMAGFLDPDKIEDTYRKIVIGEHKYIIFTIDYYATEACVEWINEILAENSDYTAIITIHEMLNRDHSFSDAYETTTPAEGLEKENWQEALSSGGNVSPRKLWEKALSKHENVKLILCGHIDEDDIKTTQLMGENGNTVTLMLIDGQTIDKSVESVGLVTMFYISADGKVMNVEYISTVRDAAGKNAYLKGVNQFEITVDYSDANGNGWTETPYGNIPTEFYSENTFHILVDDDGVEGNDTFYHGGFSNWSDVLDKIDALNRIGGIGSRTSRRIFVLLSKDHSFDGDTTFSLSSIPSGVVLDLNGKTLTVDGEGKFLPYYNVSSEHSASISVINGSVVMKGNEFISLQTLESGANSSVRIDLEDLSVTWDGSSASFVSTLDGYSGITASVNLNVKNCSFDTSKEEAKIEIFDLNDKNDNSDSLLKLTGGEINGTTLANTVIASVNEGSDSILFGKNSSDKYLAITLTESAEFDGDYRAIAGWKLKFTAKTSTSPYRYEMEEIADLIEQTPYGGIPTDYYPVDDYPLALFQNGEIVTAYTSWSEFYSRISEENTAESKNTVLYLRRDLDHDTSVSNNSNKLRTIKHITIDLGKNTLSASGHHIFTFVAWGGVDFTANIFVKNGTLRADRSNSPIITFNSANSVDADARFNITLTDVTIEKTNSGRIITDAFANGTYGCVNTVILNNCIIDATGETQLCKLDESNEQNKIDIAVIINGGKIIANKDLVFATYSASRESGKGSPDSLSFGKYNGVYTTYVNSSFAAPDTAFNTVGGGTAYFTPSQTAGEYILVEEDLSLIEKTPHGNISLEAYPLEEYPLVLFQSGEVVAAYTAWSEFYSLISNVDTDESKNTVLYLRRDLDHDTTVSNTNNKLRTIKHITIDLGGNTLSASGHHIFTFVAWGNVDFTANIFVENGTLRADRSNSPIITFNSANKNVNADARFNITLTDVTIEKTNTGRVVADAFSDGTYGCVNTVTLNNCIIDATGETQLCKFNEGNEQNKIDISVIINGGKIIANKDLVFATFSDERESGKGSPDSLSFGEYNGAYTTYVNTAYAAPTTKFDTTNGGTASFIATQTPGEYILVEDTSLFIEKTPYGDIQTNLYPDSSYPIVAFQNGKFAAAYTSWSDFYSQIVNLDTAEANNTVLYFRADVDHTASVANANNQLNTVKHLTIDLNGKTLSASGAQIFSCVNLGSADFTTNIFVKNGSVSANKSGSPIITFNGSTSSNIKASFNITFTDVTLSRTASGRLLADAFSAGKIGSTNTVVLNNCIIDATGETQLCKLEEANDQNKLDIAIIINGGKIIANKDLVFATFSAERESGKGSPDSLTFGKYNGAYTTYVNTAYAAPTTAFDTVNEGKAFFKETQTAGEYLLTLCTHSGGKATCSSKAVCQLCGKEYGDYGDCASFSFDSFSGRYLCVSCGARCRHVAFTDGKCDACGLVCAHDWKEDGANATCLICGETCATNDIPTIDANCSACHNSTSYVNGICTNCNAECTHVFNAGGHCVFCGEFGNAITFADGKNGGANASSGNGNILVAGDYGYVSADGSYKQLWDYRDTNGDLLGRNYVFSAKFIFEDWQYVSSNTAGTTRLLIWADGDVSASTTQFALYMFGNKEKLELSPDHDDSSPRMTLELNKEYDIRVAVRSVETSEGVFAQVAEISVNGQLMWTRSFELTAENGMAIRLGDHTARKTQVKYSVSKDFGIRCIDDTINFIGIQEKENADYNYGLTYDLRFIFGIEDIYLGDVGVKIEAEMTGGELYEDVSGELVCSSSRTVLKNIMANQKICTPGAYGAGYGGSYIALAITDIPLDISATYTFTLTPYVTYHDRETVFSDDSYQISVSFVDGDMVVR